MAETTTEKEVGVEFKILNSNGEPAAEDAVDGGTQESDQLSLVERLKKTISKYIKLLQIISFGVAFLIILIVSLFNVFAPKEKEIPEEKTNKLMDFLKKQGLANLAPVLDGTNYTAAD